jgi:hypothetical protein
MVIGSTEDLVAIKLATDSLITWKTIGIIVLIAIPFAIIGEILADRIGFVKLYRKIFRKPVS